MQDLILKASMKPNVEQSSEFKKCGWSSLINHLQINSRNELQPDTAWHFFLERKNSLAIYISHRRTARSSVYFITPNEKQRKLSKITFITFHCGY